jgi:hypothetical protein
MFLSYCENATFCGKKKFADGIKINDFKKGKSSLIIQLRPNIPQKPLKVEKEVRKIYHTGMLWIE